MREVPVPQGFVLPSDLSDIFCDFFTEWIFFTRAESEHPFLTTPLEVG